MSAEQYVRDFPAERDYAEFLADKVPVPPKSGIEASDIHPSLTPFHAAIVKWAVRRGRCAIFADTGLWKTSMQIEWCRQVARDGRGLIIAPLGVNPQTVLLGANKLDAEIRQVSCSAEIGERGLFITNYEKLHRFDPRELHAVALDESSILKSITGATRNKLVADWTCVPYRLCCTATPAPNDQEELANHAEFLGIMTRREMLSTFFVHDEQHWRVKGHAKEAFYRWMASWACYVRRPSDLGFPDDGFTLPRLSVEQVSTETIHRPDRGKLFPGLAPGIQGRLTARRNSQTERIERTVELINSRPGKWLVWCGLNSEGQKLSRQLGDQAVLIEGPDKPEVKIERERAWREGDVRVLITKQKIFGFGMNWQHCHQMVCLGLSDSWEQYYQGIRRCWRYGQKHDVEVFIVVSDAEGDVVDNVRRKEEEAQATAREVIACMSEWEKAEIVGRGAVIEKYETEEESEPGWKMMLGDSTERLKEIGTKSIGLSLHSPPFAQLYTYSASSRDLGNSSDYQQFFEHYRYIVKELLRVTQPGRRACVHVQQIAMTNVMQGLIAWRDFRGDVLRLYVDCGWIYHGEIVIDKDPQAQAIRTKSKTLLFVQKDKDSSWSIPAMADYILLFRAPGENAVPIDNDVSNEEWIRWARPIWYGIREAATLQAEAARAEDDEKHIAVLQLETCERCIRLWSNQGETVLDPFSGIGTTGHVALRSNRKFIGIELKPEYYREAVLNLRAATSQEVLNFSEVIA
jgi:DNA modification methylase